MSSSVKDDTDSIVMLSAHGTMVVFDLHAIHDMDNIRNLKVECVKFNHQLKLLPLEYQKIPRIKLNRSLKVMKLELLKKLELLGAKMPVEDMSPPVEITSPHVDISEADDMSYTIVVTLP